MDARKCEADWGLTVSSCVELQHVVARSSQQLRQIISNTGVGLAAIVDAACGVSLIKDPMVRFGNWEVITKQDMHHANSFVDFRPSS